MSGLVIGDRSAVQGKVKWKIKDKDVLEGKSKITYVSPGGFSFVDKHERDIFFDWTSSGSDVEDDMIISEMYGLDYDYINENLNDNGHEELIQEEHRLELFKEFDHFTETFCFLDVDNKEKEIELECIYFELFDPISNEVLMLIGECD